MDFNGVAMTEITFEFIVPHCGPTVNLYDRIYAARGERIEAIWPVAARHAGPVGR
jgi:hypothetical protein